MSSFLEKLNPFSVEDQFAADERFKALSVPNKMKYRRIFRLFLRQSGSGAISKETREEKKELWKNFCFAFFAIEKESLEEYAAKAATFPKERFSIVPLVSDNPSSFETDNTYKYRAGGDNASADEAVAWSRIYMDAPLGYGIGFTRPAEKGGGTRRDIISVITFLPDFEQNVLLIDQLQGSDTHGIDDRPKETLRSRMKFSVPPEEILYDLARTLAHQTGMRAVGLRKKENNRWRKVREPVLRFFFSDNPLAWGRAAL